MMSTLSRRSFLKGAAATAGLGFVASAGALAGCSPEANTDASDGQAGSAESSCFIGYGTGCKDQVSALVTIENGTITAVVPGKNNESQGPGTNALDILGKRIVEAQSINVDTVTGATFTSMGYLAAVKEAVKKSGLADKFDVAPEPQTIDRSDESYDIVIVGAGGAGLMAAMTIKYPEFNNVVSDTKVIVLEKLDFPGGSTSLSSGGFAVNDGLKAHDAMGVHCSVGDMVDLLEKRSEQAVNVPLIENIFSQAADTMQKITEFGAPYTTSYTSRTRKFFDHTYLQINSTENILLHNDDGSKKTLTNEGGYSVADYLKTKVLQSDTEIRTGASVVAIESDKGTVTGVRVQERSAEYTIKAKKVILACGGFTKNKDMMAELNSELPGIMAFCCAGCNGDGFALTKDFGAQIVGNGAISYLGIDSQWGIFGDLSLAARKTPAIFVTEEGRRVMREPGYDENEAVYTVCNAPGNRLIGVCDSNHPNAAIVEKYLSTGRGYKADTIEELAESTGIDATALADTISAYNAAYDAGEDAEFETPHDEMTPVVSAPFYAYDLHAIAIGTMVGIKVDENCLVVGNGDSPVGGLYAVGEMCLGGNVLSKTYMGGISVGNALSTGRIAAEHAIANL